MFELWALPQGGTPKSLGVIPSGDDRPRAACRAGRRIADQYPGARRQSGAARRIADRTLPIGVHRADVLIVRGTHAGERCDRRLARGRRIELLDRLERIAVGAVFHLPARGMQFGAQAIGFGPVLRLARGGPRLRERADSRRARASLRRLPCREIQARTRRRSAAASRASPPRAGRRASTSHASASARGVLRSSLTYVRELREQRPRRRAAAASAAQRVERRAHPRRAPSPPHRAPPT